MSVTFWMPQAPLVRVAPYPDEPDYFELCPAAPFTEVNMCNSNASDLLKLVKPGADINYGEWGPLEIQNVRINCMRLLNLRPEAFCVNAENYDNLYVGGRDMDYVKRRLTDMLVLLTVAQQHGFNVLYA